MAKTYQPLTCARCGRTMPYREAGTYDEDGNFRPLCHPFDAPSPMTCYHLVTVYGESCG